MASKNLKEIVYETVLEDIYASKYVANEIITEASLIKRFGYSKSPIREALQMLSKEGILKNIPRCGYQVIPLTAKDVEEIQEFRIILETGMIRSGLSHMDSAYFSTLKDLALLCAKKTNSVFEHWVYNTDFHVALISATGNAYACEALRGSMNRLWRAYVQIHYGTWQNAVPLHDTKHHNDIIKALENKDIERAVKCLRDDLDDFGTN